MGLTRLCTQQIFRNHDRTVQTAGLILGPLTMARKAASRCAHAARHGRQGVARSGPQQLARSPGSPSPGRHLTADQDPRSRMRTVRSGAIANNCTTL
jgi:hypothetical protein